VMAGSCPDMVRQIPGMVPVVVFPGGVGRW